MIIIQKPAKRATETLPIRSDGDWIENSIARLIRSLPLPVLTLCRPLCGLIQNQTS